MVKIPIVLKLKKQSYREIARAQDTIIEELYKIFERAVLHGGTAIWRCYNGNRFSEDVDVYIPRNEKKIESYFDSLKKRGFIILKKKVSDRSIFSNLQLNNTVVRFEATFQTKKSVLREYETAPGELITIRTLTPEDIIKEKVEAYLKRAKIRDIYDIFFLLKYADKNKVKKELKELIKKFKMPSDEKQLRVLIIGGLTPSSKEILDYIRRDF
jgi:predicted nucleotidyltransferase component of viral defense system